MNHKTSPSLIVGLTLVLLLLAGCGTFQPPLAATPTPPTSSATLRPSATAVPTSASAQAAQPAAARAQQGAARTHLVIDTDMGVDDVMAILYLLSRSDVDVKAITVAGTGLVHCGAGTRHALSLVALAGAGGIPVACGREKPLQGIHAFPAEWRAATDGLTQGLTLPGGGTVSGQSAVELLKTAIGSSPEKVVLVTLGPLTNVAEALQDKPELADNMKMIYTMGGAVNVPGNVTGVPLPAPNRMAEFNIFVDPRAANIVLKSGAPITLVPLDATNQVPITIHFYTALKENHMTPEAAILFDLFRANQYLYQGGNYFWDPLAAAIATDETLATFETKRLSVVEDEGPESGRTVATDAGSKVRVAVAADAVRFEGMLLSTLNGGKEVTIGQPARNTTPTPDMTVRFSGDKCTYQGPHEVPAGLISVDWIVEDKDHEVFGLALVTLDKDKTFADLDAWPSTDQPPWLHHVGFWTAQPASRSMVTTDVETGPIYLVCFTAYPETKTGALGPVEVKE